MKKIKEFNNKLLGRVEVEFEVENDSSTLSREEAKKNAVKALKADENLVVVNSIKSHFGSKISTVIVYVYEDDKTLKRLTPKHINNRNTVEQASAEE